MTDSGCVKGASTVTAKQATIRSILGILTPAGSGMFCQGLRAAEVDVDAPVPLVGQGPPTFFTLSPAVLREVGMLARDGKKIEAIKTLRTATGWTLVECKDAINAFLQPSPYG